MFTDGPFAQLPAEGLSVELGRPARLYENTQYNETQNYGTVLGLAKLKPVWNGMREDLMATLFPLFVGPRPMSLAWHQCTRPLCVRTRPALSSLGSQLAAEVS